MDIALLVVIPALAMAAAHWFPWRKTFGRDLPRTIAYGYGMVIILVTVTFVTWAMRPEWPVFIGYLWIAALAAGAATLAAYAIDAAVEARHLRADMKDKAEHERAG
jgi:hypothetical protein